MPKVEHDRDLASDVIWPGELEDVAGALERGWVLFCVIGGQSRRQGVLHTEVGL